MSMKKKLTLLIAFAINTVIVNAQSWSLTGNASTNPPTNFLGTTDAKRLILKVNNQLSGLIDYDNTKLNTAFGYQTLLSNTGTTNSAFGYQTLNTNTTGSYNDAFGTGALQRNTTGGVNSAFVEEFP